MKKIKLVIFVITSMLCLWYFVEVKPLASEGFAFFAVMQIIAFMIYDSSKEYFNQF